MHVLMDTTSFGRPERCGFTQALPGTQALIIASVKLTVNVQTWVRRFRPLLRRAANTLRPPTVLRRER